MAPGFIRLNGLEVFIAGFALYALVLLVAALTALWLLFRRDRQRRWVGAGLLLVLLGYGLLPALVTQVRAARQIAEVQSLAFWPAELHLEGRSVVFVSVGGDHCDAACESAATHSGARVHAVSARIGFDARGEVETIDPGSGPSYRLLTQRDGTARREPVATVPPADITFVRDDSAWLTGHDPGLFDLTPRQAALLDQALYVFEGGVPLDRSRLIARLPFTRPKTVAPFLLIAGPDSRGQGMGRETYDLLLAEWLCSGQEAAGCRFLY